jgi:pimeloyl-ACP methyl ester carboxylesterase
MARHIPRNELVLLNAEGHLPHLSAPPEVTLAIQKFVSASTV